MQRKDRRNKRLGLDKCLIPIVYYLSIRMLNMDIEIDRYREQLRRLFEMVGIEASTVYWLGYDGGMSKQGLR